MATINDYIKKAKIQGFALTKFLDTTESSDLRKVKNPLIKVYYNGGFIESERVRAIIIDKNEEDPQDYEFEISLIKVKLKADFREISHRNVLGTLMSFGIKRETIGDIVVNENEIYIFVVSDIVNLLLDQLKEINKIAVNCSVVDLMEFKTELKEETQLINVASKRLDAVISKILNKSRNDTNEIIKKGLVQINHIVCDNISYQLKSNDLISIRHYGRILIKDVVNITRKDRLILEVSIKH
ncbi:MAG: hypothetical protein IKC22_04990 [Bacilli bacterium]|nr:hypothetical protein [Bacilli bacterium]